MIKVNNVSKEFTKEVAKNKKEKFLADNNISFEAKDGQILGILGPNGAGKTTLLRMIAGIMEPTSGSIEIGGMTYDKDPIEIKKQIAFLSGNTKLYKDISPVELLKMCCEFYDVPKDKQAEEIQKVIDRFDMQKFAHQRIGNLSTGQTQRVGIARCVVHNPKYYILDEATSGLDIISSQVILDFIKEERERGKCILYSTHYMEEAENICDNVVLVHKGEVLKIDTPENIIKDTNTTNLRDAFFAMIGGVQND